MTHPAAGRHVPSRLSAVIVRVLPMFVCSFPAVPTACAAWPEKPVRIVVPFPAGTGLDVTTRLYANRYAEEFGQQFVIDNRAGAAGTIGAAQVARAAVDGYTVLAASASVASAGLVQKDLPYDIVKQFRTAALLASAPFILVVHPSLPVRSVSALVEFAKRRPGELTYASSGLGSSPHITMEMFARQGSLSMLHVPYQGSPQALTDVVGGRVTAMFTISGAALPLTRSGRLRPLAISSSARSAVAPDLPTVAESGFPGFQAGSWSALLVPAAVPGTVADALFAATARLSKRGDVRERLLTDGAEPLELAQAEAMRFVASEVERWRQALTGNLTATK